MDAFEILQQPDYVRPVRRGRPNLYDPSLILRERMRLAQQTFQKKKRDKKKLEELQQQQNDAIKRQREINQKLLKQQQSLINKNIQLQNRQNKIIQKQINKTRNERNRNAPTLISQEEVEQSSGNTYINYRFNPGNMPILNVCNYIINIYQQNIRELDKVRFYFTIPQGNGGFIEISTPYVSLDDILSNVEELFRSRQGRYDGLDAIEEIQFTILKPNLGAGASAHKSIMQAEKIWYVLNKSTRTNCAYTAVYLCMNPSRLDEFIKNPQCLNDPAKKLKKHVNPEKKQYSSDDELQKLCNYIKRPIEVRNNIYQKIKTFEPLFVSKDKRNRKTKTKELIQLQLKDNHYLALIKKSDVEVKEDYKKKLEDKIEKLEKYEQVCKKITKRPKYEKFNNKIAAWDIETFLKNNYVVKSYAVGFAMYKDGEEFYHDFWGMDCHKQFFEFLYDNRILLDQYTLYAHNGGKFDIMNAIREYLVDSNKWIITNNIELNGSFINLKIKSNDGYEITFLDSMKMLDGSLDKLTKEFKVEHKKLTETVNHDEINENNYDKIPELVQYLKNDCLGLLEVVSAFSESIFDETYVNRTYFSKSKNQEIHEEGGLNMSNMLTGASLASQWFWNRKYNPWKYPIYTNTDAIDSFIRKSYYGGRVEISQLGLIEKHLYYTDFTSMYPSEGCNDLPYGEPIYTDFNNSDKLPNDFFGFLRCLIKTKRTDIRPLHGDKSLGKLCFRIHEKWEEKWLFSEEVRYGIEKDQYYYQFIDGYKYKKAKILKESFEECFQKKAKAKTEGNPVLASCHKKILNSLYGMWGIRTKDRDTVKIYPRGDSAVFEYLHKGKLYNECDTGNYTILRVSADLDNKKDFNVGIASAISSYGRIRLTKLIHDIEEKGYKVYMNDTDSIVSDCNMSKYPDLMLKYMWDGCGDALGSLKNEADEKVEKLVNLNIDKHLPLELYLTYQNSGKEVQKKLLNYAIDNLKKNENNMFHFDRGIFCGCKFYSLEKDFGDTKIDITKCKGYKQTKNDQLKFKDMQKLINKNELSDKPEFGYFDVYSNHLQQKQSQFRIPKSSMLNETNPFEYTIPKITKFFKQIYTKGNVQNDGKITPLINK